MEPKTVDHIETQICLVTPAAYQIDAFAKTLGDVLAVGGVSSLIVTSPNGSWEDESILQEAADVLVPLAQQHNVAVLIHNSTRVMGRSGADGVHMDGTRDDLVAAARAHGGEQIIGAGNLKSRHEAMEVGEGPVDYLFFGRLDGDTDEGIFPKSFKLAEWWANLFQIPAMVMGGSALASVTQAYDGQIDFIALRDVIWTSDNPVVTMGKAIQLLEA